jgi:hypothetical protein
VEGDFDGSPAAGSPAAVLVEVQPQPQQQRRRQHQHQHQRRQQEQRQRQRQRQRRQQLQPNGPRKGEDERATTIHQPLGGSCDRQLPTHGRHDRGAVTPPARGTRGTGSSKTAIGLGERRHGGMLLHSAGWCARRCAWPSPRASHFHSTMRLQSMPAECASSSSMSSFSATRRRPNFAPAPCWKRIQSPYRSDPIRSECRLTQPGRTPLSLSLMLGFQCSMRTSS